MLHTAADGNGPVNALDAALRKALRAFYPRPRRRPPRRLQGPDPRRRRGDGRPDPGDHRLDGRRRASGRRWAATRTSSRPRRSALADSLEYAIWKAGAELRRRDERHFTTAPGREVDDRRAPARPRAPDGDADGRTTADTLHLARWTVTSGSQRPQPRRRRHRLGRPPVARRRPRATARSTRCSGPSTRRSPSVLTGHPRLLALRRPRARRGARRRGPGDGHDRAAAGRRRGPRRAAEYTGEAREHEHHRRLDRGLHRGAQRAARRGALGRRDRGGRQLASGRGSAANDARAQRAEIDEDAGQIDTTDWFNQ